MEPRVVEVTGDLFTCPSTHSLAHCISADCRLGKGIAAIFKRKFGGISELLAQRKKPGEVAVLRRGSRYVYNLITKHKYYEKPTYETLRRALSAVKEHCVTHEVRHLAMPRIGCGLDGLTWDRVLPIIKDVFQDCCVQVEIFSL
ncbi:ADP-ribose glycohydrolase OARD1-like [Pollicipes pollicipes]|uniref:ADP-ribose glycohydrolase OARD1-like n=1 Tax=Pollicipes pollicipes TaxID=41117 RepID=UPI001884A109|nr:ADP-ribose glycohydrolase OARD1-like [Pollicipes pollicipes]XP_037087231.1 ADP-ribose glycohydrolase OARD1-like [Pollicipes pollicipes]XP_037087532.1 ADP-ribose glycohydrolase OARD1-like [Pollicipes pollicipes]